jgi:hypothetical protein
MVAFSIIDLVECFMRGSDWISKFGPWVPVQRSFGSRLLLALIVAPVLLFCAPSCDAPEVSRQRGASASKPALPTPRISLAYRNRSHADLATPPDRVCGYASSGRRFLRVNRSHLECPCTAVARYASIYVSVPRKRLLQRRRSGRKKTQARTRCAPGRVRLKC